MTPPTTIGDRDRDPDDCGASRAHARIAQVRPRRGLRSLRCGPTTYVVGFPMPPPRGSDLVVGFPMCRCAVLIRY